MLSSWSSTTRILYFSLRSIVFAEESLHLRDYGSRLTGLREVSVAADLHRLLAIGGEGVRGQRDDRNPFRRGIVLQDLGCLPAVDDRDGYIHQDQVRFFRPRLCDSFLSIQGFSDLVAEVLQNGGINYPVILVVLDQQYHFT